jgi:hypothetical protein
MYLSGSLSLQPKEALHERLFHERLFCRFEGSQIYCCTPTAGFSAVEPLAVVARAAKKLWSYRAR